MLNNSIGVFFYLLLQNRWSWALLKEEEREIIFEANECHNNDRQDYSWESYQGSKNWDSEDDRAGSYRIGWGPWIMKFLEEKKPRSILEIGPGSGYFSKIICEHKSVSSYYGLEINKNFSDYLNRKLKNLQKNNFKYKIIQGDWKSTDLPKVDAIVILSALHHIPDRQDLFKKLYGSLNSTGKLLAIEPTHHLPRILQLSKKYFLYYRKKDYWMHRPHLSTHHFLTLGEYKSLCRTSGLSMDTTVLTLSHNPSQRNRYSILFKILSNREKSATMEYQDSILKYLCTEIRVILSKPSRI